VYVCVQGLFKVIEGEDSKVLNGFIEMFDYVKKKFNWWDGVFTRRTVTELLFGYDDPLLSFLKKDLEHFSWFSSIRSIADSINPRFNYSVSGRSFRLRCEGGIVRFLLCVSCRKSRRWKLLIWCILVWVTSLALTNTSCGTTTTT